MRLSSIARFGRLSSTTKFVASGLQILCYVRFHLERHLVSYNEERLPDETKSDGRINALAMTSQRSAVKYYWLWRFSYISDASRCCRDDCELSRSAVTSLNDADVTFSWTHLADRKQWLLGRVKPSSHYVDWTELEFFTNQWERSERTNWSSRTRRPWFHCVCSQSIRSRSVWRDAGTCTSP